MWLGPRALRVSPWHKVHHFSYVVGKDEIFNACWLIQKGLEILVDVLRYWFPFDFTYISHGMRHLSGFFSHLYWLNIYTQSLVRSKRSWSLVWRDNETPSIVIVVWCIKRTHVKLLFKSFLNILFTKIISIKILHKLLTILISLYITFQRCSQPQKIFT